MFSKQDIAILKGMFETQRKDIISEIRDEMDARFAASENRIREDIGWHIDQAKVEMIEFIDSSLLSQISDLDQRTTRVEQHLKLA